MRRKVHNEDGYTLLIALLLILLFVILGAGLMALSLSGVNRNETREEIVQSKDLASMGIERIVTQITSDLDNFISTGQKTPLEFNNKFNELINKYKCTDNETQTISVKATGINTGTKFDACITGEPTNDLKSLVTFKNSDLYLRKFVTFKSLGVSGTTEEAVYSTYNMGAKNHPEVLNYAVGTFKSDKGNGNLYLNGGIYIQGDVQVAGDLVTSDHGITRTFTNNEKPEKDFSHASLLPELASINNRPPKLYVEGSLFSLEDHSTWSYTTSGNFNYEKYTTSDLKTLNEVVKVEKEEIAKLFYNKEINNIPTLISTPSTVKPYDFTPKLSSMRYTQSQATDVIRLYSLLELFGPREVTEGSKKDSAYLLSCRLLTCQDNTSSTFDFIRNTEFKRLATAGNARFRQNANHVFSQGAYFGGNVEIGNPINRKSFFDHFRSTCDKDSTYKKISLTGAIYVKGDLSMCNVELTSNVIFYVEGDVTITESRIVGKEEGSRTTSLIIFSKGNINLSNNSVDDPDPSVIKGYFYTEKAMEIYGVGSNIKINGGIAASKIILNGIRGDNNGGKYASVIEQSKMGPEDSRLQIIYDEDIIQNYSALDVQSEAIINNLSPPIEIDRSFTPN